jgi:hypothetical protein
LRGNEIIFDKRNSINSEGVYNRDVHGGATTAAPLPPWRCGSGRFVLELDAKIHEFGHKLNVRKCKL